MDGGKAMNTIIYLIKRELRRFWNLLFGGITRDDIW